MTFKHGATRAFFGSGLGSLMMRGPTVPYDLTDDGAAAGAAAEDDISIRDLLANVLDDAEAGDAATGGDPAAPQAAADQRARDEAGRFAPKPEAGQAGAQISQPQGQGKPGEQQQPQGQVPADAGAIAPPVSWSPAAKAAWPSLPPLVQQEYAKREQEIQGWLAQQRPTAERLNRLDAVLGPLQQRLTMNGVDEATYVAQLHAANDWLDRDPIGALLELGRQKGVDWRALVGRLTNGQSPQQQLPPGVQAAFQPMLQQVQHLTSWATQQQQSQQQARIQDMEGQIGRFAADPANVYFENVRKDMARLIRAGGALSLKDAYEQAIWAKPEIRTLLLQTQEQQKQAKAAEDRRAKVARAERASGSVTGAPAPGAKPGGSNPDTSIRGSVSDAWEEHAT